jgi:hypothetical protein
VGERIKDRKVMRLVSGFLRAGVVEVQGGYADTLTGTPQGGSATRRAHVVSGSRWLEVRLMPGT